MSAFELERILLIISITNFRLSIIVCYFIHFSLLPFLFLLTMTLQGRKEVEVQDVDQKTKRFTSNGKF